VFGQSNVLGALTPKYVPLLPDVFFQFHLEERWGMQIKRDICRTVEDNRFTLLLNTNGLCCIDWHNV